MGGDWIRRITNYTWRPFLVWWLKKERRFRYRDILLNVMPGVFHPGFFFSSLLLADFISTHELHHKKVLDLGSGSGLLALLAAKKGADVTATDISKTAVENIISNAAMNKIKLPVYQSDLFNDVPQATFDIIMVNPPYYKKNPVTDAEYAWYCGENMEYFKKLFQQVPAYMDDNAILYMILSDDCDINGIRSIAAMNRLEMAEVYRKKKWWEYNYIFRVMKG